MIEVCSLPTQPINWRRMIIIIYFLLLVISCIYWRDLYHYSVISVGILTFCLIHEFCQTVLEGVIKSVTLSLAALAVSSLIVTIAHAFRFTNSSVIDDTAASYVYGAAALTICSGVLAAILKSFWIQKSR